MTSSDCRQVSHGCAERPMTDAEFELCEFAEPAFDDFNELWRRVETFVQTEGVDPLRDGTAS